MCGIVGYIGEGKEHQFSRALNNIAHRGPDNEGTWHDENITLGHRRLSIIDLSSSANQPMLIENRYCIVFNGEIYNYREIKSELQSEGEKFITDSDTEVLVKVIRRYGPDGLNKLNGMWAFALWDKEEKTLMLSRDRVGKKPLFYAFLGDGTFVFGSEMKAIYPFLADVNINDSVFVKAIQNNFSYEHTENCLIAGVKRFPAASWSKFHFSDSESKLKFHTYWSPGVKSVSVPRDFKQQAEQLRFLIEDACRIRMRSDVKTGTALSGGLDSSVITATINNLTKNTAGNFRHAFIASFPGTELDETEFALSVTDAYNIPREIIEIDPYADIDNIYHQTYLFEEFYYALPLPFVQLYRKVRENGITVSIDGHGADELFGGYPFDLTMALADSLPNPARFLSNLQAINEVSGQNARHDLYNKLKFALASRYSIFKKLSPNTPAPAKIGELDLLNSKLYISSFKTILPTLLRNYDRYSMINGVEIRMPFLDHRIIDFAFSIPGSSKINGGYSKAIIREAFRDVLPEKISQRKRKIGFNPPINSWMQNQLKTFILDTINSKDFTECVYLDSRKVKLELESQLSNEKGLSFEKANATFEKLMPYIWCKSLTYAR